MVVFDPRRGGSEAYYRVVIQLVRWCMRRLVLLRSHVDQNYMRARIATPPGGVIPSSGCKNLTKTFIQTLGVWNPGGFRINLAYAQGDYQRPDRGRRGRPFHFWRESYIGVKEWFRLTMEFPCPILRLRIKATYTLDSQYVRHHRVEDHLFAWL